MSYCSRITAIIILVTFKRIGSHCRALFWKRQASNIPGLVLSVCVCVVAGYSGEASAQSRDASSTGFADHSMNVGENPVREVTSARYNTKALPEMIGARDRHSQLWVSYYQRKHLRSTSHKVNRYARHHAQHHPSESTEVPRYETGPSLIVQNAALHGGSGRYLWKRGIVTTIFWIGERPGGHNPVPNVRSSWDRYWYYRYGGYDNPDTGSRRNFIPVKFVPHQNPFYFALPYNDVQGGHTKYEARRVIPWFKQAFVRDGRSVLKDRWIAIRHGNRVCYAQWEDCGPFSTDDWRYVFGDEHPRPNLNQGAGLDVSPAVRDYLGLGVKDPCDWKFVEFREVPHGPWASYGDNNAFVILGRQSSQRLAGK